MGGPAQGEVSSPSSTSSEEEPLDEPLLTHEDHEAALGSSFRTGHFRKWAVRGALAWLFGVFAGAVMHSSNLVHLLISGERTAVIECFFIVGLLTCLMATLGLVGHIQCGD